jgi:hypothetical protein
MATTYYKLSSTDRERDDGLMRAERSIGGPWFDALLLWGQPAIAFVITVLCFTLALRLPDPAGQVLGAAFATFVAILTYAHLIAVAPRAYLNRDVFQRFSKRLLIVPVLLTAGFAMSTTLLVLGMVLTIFWDVHHSAMQTFGLGRIYDMKAGNHPLALRRVDMALNWALYVGPIAAGASMIVHVAAFGKFSVLGWSALTQAPVLAAGLSGWIRLAGIVIGLAVIAWSAWQYRLASLQGYRVPVHKAALLGVTASVSVAAWGLSPPLVAFAAINLFHAVQYFALVWLKEGKQVTRLAGGRAALERRAGLLFVAACMVFGIVYWAAMQFGGASARWFLAPFIACSLLHFWYDGFVWSVRAKQV